MAITRLSGGTTPPNGSDPRTFPAIFNAAATDIEAAEAAISTIQSDLTNLEIDDLGDVTITTPADGEVLIYDDGTSEWVNSGGDFYSKTNILGTVSETSGVPTGAIIETGTNSNGTFIKYADGTQICNFDIPRVELGAASTSTSILGLSGFRTDTPFVWTMPSDFISPPTFSAWFDRSAPGNDSIALSIGTVGSGTYSSTQIGGIACVVNASLGSGFHPAGYFIAIGRWF